MNTHPLRRATRQLMIALTIVLATAGALLTAETAPAAAASSAGILKDGQVLPSGATLSSSNGYRLVMQKSDGNLVLYVCNHALWASSTQDQGAWAAMKSGVLEIVDPSDGVPIKTFGPGGTPGANLAVQPDGHLVMYAPPTLGGSAIWVSGPATGYTPLCGGSKLLPGATLFSPSGQYELVMQSSDGNLVLYQVNVNPWKPLWYTGVTKYPNNPGYWAIMQASDGNFVVYTGPYPDTSAPLWWTATNSSANKGAYLGVRDSGNVTVFSPGGNPLWQAPMGNRFQIGPNCTGTAWGNTVLAGSLWAPGVSNADVMSNSYNSSCANTYWNGYDSFGLKYQCTELAVRWANTYLGIAPSAWGNLNNLAAKDMFGLAQNIAGLQAIANGAAAPQYGDILVLSDSGVGHVAVVEGVSGGYLYFVGENQTQAEDRIKIQNGNYLLSSDVTNWLQTSGSALGWIRAS